MKKIHGDRQPNPKPTTRPRGNREKETKSGSRLSGTNPCQNCIFLNNKSVHGLPAKTGR
uniref:Uncharacterized protein n=1 Tax=Arundo donax TaxID=35708 RepID=A0A0A9GLJ6_ARUDO